MPILLEFSGQYLLYWDAPPSTIRRGEVSLVVERQRNLLATYSLCGDVLECYSPFFTSSFGGRPGTELALNWHERTYPDQHYRIPNSCPQPLMLL